jgi:hypothetical protein
VPAAADEITPLYRAIRFLGAVAIVIFAVGAVEFIVYEPPGQATGTVAHIEGVYSYDPQADQLHGQPAEHFTRKQLFAAKVDWSSLPAEMLVDARWFNSFGEVVGKVDPAPAGRMTRSVIPIAVPKGLDRNLPGTYIFVVERIAHGQPVEVVGRRLVRVGLD